MLRPSRRIVLAAALVLALTPAAALADSIKVGLASPGPLADPVNIAVQEAKAQGLEVEVIEFTDWIAPNEALANDDIDVNYFQHQIFLDNAAAARGYDFTSVGIGTSSKIGLYSLKHTSFDQIPEGGTVAIANDPVNGARGLLLLQKAGLITLTPDVDVEATVADITANPRNLKIVEVVAQQLPRSLGDVDIAVGYAHLLKDYGVDPTKALLFDGIQDRFALQWVVKKDGQKIDAVKKFVAIYQQSPAVKAAIKDKFGDLIIPAWDKSYTVGAAQ